jgi:hypothetical protein
LTERARDERGVLTVRWRGPVSAFSAAILGTVAWVAVLCLVLRKYGLRGHDAAAEFPFVLQAVVAVCVLGIAGGLFFTVCQIYGGRAVFAPAIHTVIFSGLTGKRSVMSFESVARVAPMEEVTLLSARTVFCLVPKLSPLFGISVISGPLKRESEKYADFERRIIPEITRMLRIDGTRMSRKGVRALPTARYRKDGACYVKNFAGSRVLDMADAVIPLILMLLFLSFRPFRAPIPDIHPTVFGAAVCVLVIAVPHIIRGFTRFFFRGVRSVCIDTGALELRVKRGIFGWGGVRAHPFSSVKRFEVFWRTSMGENFSGRSISLVLDTYETIEVIPNGRKGKDIADEMRFLAGMFGLDPVLDITYKRGTAMFSRTGGVTEV